MHRQVQHEAVDGQQQTKAASPIVAARAGSVSSSHTQANHTSASDSHVTTCRPSSGEPAIHPIAAASLWLRFG